MRFFQQKIVNPEELPMPLSWALTVILYSNTAILLEAKMTTLKLPCFRNIRRSQSSLEKTTVLRKTRQQDKRKTTHDIRSHRHVSTGAETPSQGHQESELVQQQVAHGCHINECMGPRGLASRSILSVTLRQGFSSTPSLSRAAATTTGCVNRGFRQEGIQMLSISLVVS